jgi:hypothetical protein
VIGEQVEVAYEDGRSVSASADDVFFALVAVRRALEAEGLLLECYGASRNVWPSGMALSMNGGRLAYRMTLGQPGRQDDLVGIFETGPDVAPVTVQEQEAFVQQWRDSLPGRS